MTPSGTHAEKLRLHTAYPGRSLDVFESGPMPVKLVSSREPEQTNHGAASPPIEVLAKGAFHSLHLDPYAAFHLDIRLDDVLPLTRKLRNDHAGSVFEECPTGFAAEQFRLMQRRLANVRPDGGAVLLTSPGACDGKSLNAHNLAWALAEARHTTLLLELDLRRPTQVDYFNAEYKVSVASVLAGNLSPAAALRKLDGLPLFLMGLDEPAEEPIPLLRSDALKLLISWATRNFKWVVIDAPPILPVADVEELLPSADLVLMVVRERATPRAMVLRAADRLGKRLDYLILNDVTVSHGDGYGYDYN